MKRFTWITLLIVLQLSCSGKSEPEESESETKNGMSGRAALKNSVAPGSLQITQVAVAKRLQKLLGKEDYGKIVDLMLPLKLAKSKGLLNDFKLKKYATELEGLATKSRKYKQL